MIKIKDFSKYVFLPETGRMMYYYVGCAVFRMWAGKEKTWKHRVTIVSKNENHKFQMFFVVNEKDSVFDKTLQTAVSDTSYLQKIEDHITKVRVDTLSKLISLDINTASNEELISAFDYYYKQFENMMGAGGTLRLIDRGLINKFKIIFGNRANECMQLISVSKRPTHYTQEQITILELAAKLSKKGLSLDSPEAVSGIKNLCNKFCWSVVGYYNEPAKSYETYIDSIKKAIDRGPKNSLAELNEHLRNQEVEREKLIMGLSEENKVIANIASESTFIKDYFRFSTNDMMYHAEPLFQEIANRTGKSVDFLKDLSPDEIITLLKGENINEESIKERINNHVMIGYLDSVSLLVGKDALDFENKYLKSDIKKDKMFKGRTASPGYGKGKARIILENTDFYKMHTGDILISINTNPDFVPIMRKAAAIVAEEGGLTAHVSVISREMGIPCVVGVNNVTRELKDGNLVEVDADKGIVRKIR